MSAAIVLGAFALGAALGLTYLALLWRAVRRTLAARAGGAPSFEPAALAVGRLLLVACGLWLCAQLGAPALLAALLGFLVARTAVTARVRGSYA